MNYSGVTVYATKTCPYCTMLTDWLTQKNVQHAKIFVDSDRQAAIDIMRKTGQMGVPITEITYPDRNAEFIVGFDRPQLAYMLGVGA